MKIQADKAINAILYILERTSGKCDFHKLFKLLYFADMKHLARYGSPVWDDKYIAMKNGPVPSKVYDFFKMLKERYNCFDQDYTCFADAVEVKDDYMVYAKKTANADFLAESDIECLSESIKENKALSFKELTQKSHDSAYRSADRHDHIKLTEIAKVGGADRSMLKYIKTVSENAEMFA